MCRLFMRQPVVWMGVREEMGQMTLLPWNTCSLYSPQTLLSVLVARSGP